MNSKHTDNENEKHHHKKMLKETNGKKATIYYSDDLDLDIKFIQDFVGGYFTGVNLQDGRTMLLNEEGMYKCELNEEATEMFQYNIYGNVIILGTITED